MPVQVWILSCVCLQDEPLLGWKRIDSRMFACGDLHKHSSSSGKQDLARSGAALSPIPIFACRPFKSISNLCHFNLRLLNPELANCAVKFRPFAPGQCESVADKSMWVNTPCRLDKAIQVWQVNSASTAGGDWTLPLVPFQSPSLFISVICDGSTWSSAKWNVVSCILKKIYFFTYKNLKKKKL